MKRILRLLILFAFVFLLACPSYAATPKLSKTNVVLAKGKKVKLKAKKAKKVKWASSNTSVATVSKKGVVKGKGAGVAYITATHTKGVLTCKVTVEQPVISAKSLTLTAGEVFNLNVFGTTQKIKWKSSKKKVASVKDGIIEAKKAGKCKITAKVLGKKLTCKVTVKKIAKINQDALKKAKSYLNFSSFSRAGLIHQLEYHGFASATAAWAADHSGANWLQEAIECAKSYIKHSDFSEEGLYRQLIYEKFTPEQSRYGIAHSGANWFLEAVESAQSYLKHSDFSESRLYKQLIYEKFTPDQAKYGVAHSGGNWYQEAVESVASHLRYGSYTRDRLIRLMEYEGYTKAQIEYGLSQNGL